MTSDVDAIVIGGGVVGLACAVGLAEADFDVVLVERHVRVAAETSSRNSGVIHAGLHYPASSLKGDSCRAGRKRLYEWCRRHQVPYRQTGKLVVAAASESTALEALHAHARNQGLKTEIWDRSRLRQIEPMLSVDCALHVPETGIIDAHEFARTLRAAATDAGVSFVMGHEVDGLASLGSSWEVASGDERLTGRWVVNAAGLASDRVAKLAGLDTDALGWSLHPWKGDYFVVNRAVLPRHELVYPMPTTASLGIHLTRGMDARCLAGPDAYPLQRHLLERERTYDVDPDKARAFAESIRRYWPDVEPSDLQPGYAGIRPKRKRDGTYADFVLEERPAGLIHLVGIESPGLTASLDLADRVVALASRNE